MIGQLAFIRIYPRNLAILEQKDSEYYMNHKNSQPAFDTNELLEFVKVKLQRMFFEFPVDDKTLYIDQVLLDILNFIFSHDLEPFKKKNSILQTYLFEFDEKDSEAVQDVSTHSIVVFLLRPENEHMRKVSRMILDNKSRNIKKQYFLLLSPKKTFLATDILEAAGVLSSVRVESLNFDLIPLEKDLLSLEIDKCFFKMSAEKDQMVVKLVAESILKLQSAIGMFKYTFAKGDSAHTVVQLVRQKLDELDEERYEKKESEYEVSLFLFDRECDLVTPMLTPFTYEGLIDNFYPIRLNQIMVPSELVNESSTGTKDGKVPYLICNPLDKEYPQFRNKYINFFIKDGEMICKKLKSQIQQAKEKKKSDLSLPQISAMEEQVKSNLRQYVFCQNHLYIGMDVSRKIHNTSFYSRVSQQNSMINTGSVSLETLEELTVFYPVQSILKWVSLASAVHGGLKDKQLKSIEEIICRNYGLQHSFTMRSMLQAGLLQQYISKNNWSELKNEFRLIESDTDMGNPTDYNYIFIIYASLIARMVEEGARYPRSWADYKDRYNLVKGTTHFSELKESEYAKRGKKKLIIVFMLGGITYPQIQSLRFLAKKLERQIMICTTNIVNGEQIIKQCFK